MKIGIDIDEVVVEFVRGYLKIYEKRHGQKFVFEDFFTYNLWEPLKITKEEAIEIANEFYNSIHFDNIEFVDGAKEAIYVLAERNDLFIITSRPIHIKRQTEQFIKKHFPDIFSNIFYSGDFTRSGKTKAEICRDLKLDIFLEDNIIYALECAKNGTKVFLLDKPWNQSQEEHENIMRVKHWNEILELLK